MKTAPVRLALLAAALVVPTASIAADTRGDAVVASAEARPLVFADEFDAGTLNREKWNIVGMDFWVNEEQQAYLDSPDTIRFASDVAGADGGVLVLRPVYRPGVDTREDRKADFISGRINSLGKADFTYGRIEARIKLPADEGVWPAFWMLGDGRWPDTGEIDIMEYVGETDWIGVALHGPGYSGETPMVNKHFFAEGPDATDWHTYGVEWTKDAILFELDGKLVYRATRPDDRFLRPMAVRHAQAPDPELRAGRDLSLQDQRDRTALQGPAASHGGPNQGRRGRDVCRLGAGLRAAGGQVGSSAGLSPSGAARHTHQYAANFVA
ncbi:glycoside hydrolase family 16 protein [Erythrobacter sp. NFXS35]|uniref:glycoside hydrolase family 16 protein n=1 Tax=Erythrobacter sp. NFXS35 TaxID=2818436 RepID=UPI0032DF887F